MAKKVTKILMTVLLSVAMILQITGGIAVKNAKAADFPLPFELKAPAYTALAWLQGRDSPTTMNYSYTMGADMCKFLSSQQTDTAGYEKTLKDLGIENFWINLQVDWAIDDPTNGWHYTQYWDTQGRDSNEDLRCGAWDSLFITPGATIVNHEWITRGISDIDTNDDWNGTGLCPGLKDQLKDGQYIIKNDEGTTYLTIDYAAHTLYARSRYLIVVRSFKNKVDGETEDNIYISGWSTPVGYGKDAAAWQPYTSSSLNVPEVSNLRMAKNKNGEPIAYVTQTVPDSLSKGLVNVDANGGTIYLETEARIQGTSEWIKISAERDVKSGDMEIPLIYLQQQGKTITEGTPVEIRFRYQCSQYDPNGTFIGDLYSGYSKILTVNTTTIPGAKDTTTSDPNGSEPAITSLDSGASQTQVDTFIKALKNDKDPKGTAFYFLLARQKKTAKNSITLTWQKPANASYYVIYGAKCGLANRYQMLTSVTKTTYTHKKLAKGTYYKFLVAAFDKSNKLLGVSNTLHIATKGGKFGNHKKVTTAAKKNSVTLASKGKSFKLKGKAVPESKKLTVKVHRPVRYESDNKKIATVNSSGKVTAKKKGTCNVYVYAQNGAYQKIKVTVKK